MQKKFFCSNCGAVHYSSNDFHGHEHINCLEGKGYWVEDGRRPTMRAADSAKAEAEKRFDYGASLGIQNADDDTPNR